MLHADERVKAPAAIATVSSAMHRPFRPDDNECLPRSRSLSAACTRHRVLVSCLVYWSSSVPPLFHYHTASPSSRTLYSFIRTDGSQGLLRTITQYVYSLCTIYMTMIKISRVICQNSLGLRPCVKGHTAVHAHAQSQDLRMGSSSHGQARNYT